MSEDEPYIECRGCGETTDTVTVCWTCERCVWCACREDCPEQEPNPEHAERV